MKLRVSKPEGANILQRSVYSGQKRQHCFNFQTVSTPGGLVFHLFGPIEGISYDNYLYYKSGIGKFLTGNLLIEGKQYCIYGDQDYVMRPWM